MMRGVDRRHRVWLYPGSWDWDFSTKYHNVPIRPYVVLLNKEIGFRVVKNKIEEMM